MPFVTATRATGVSIGATVYYTRYTLQGKSGKNGIKTEKMDYKFLDFQINNSASAKKRGVLPPEGFDHLAFYKACKKNGYKMSSRFTGVYPNKNGGKMFWMARVQDGGKTVCQRFGFNPEGEMAAAAWYMEKKGLLYTCHGCGKKATIAQTIDIWVNVEGKNYCFNCRMKYKK